MKALWTLALVGLTWQAKDGLGQTPDATTSPAVADVLKLSQAQVGEDAIVAFIQNSTGASLSASEIINPRSQGISDRVVIALLNQQPKVAVAPAPAVTSPSVPVAAPAPSSTPITASEAVAPYTTTTHYVDLGSYSYYPYSYYPYYGSYPYYGYYYPSTSFWLGLGFGYWGG